MSSSVEAGPATEQREEMIPLRKIPEATHWPVTVSGLRDWSSKGLSLPDGNRIALETTRVGGLIYTTKEAVDRFMKAVNDAHNAAQAKLEKRKQPRRRKSS